MSLRRKLPADFDRSALAKAARAVGIAGESVRLLLVDPGRADVVDPVLGPLTPVDFAEQALSRQIGWNEGQVVVRRQVDEVRHAEAGSETGARDDRRRQKSGLLIDGRVGRRKIGKPEDGKAPEQKLSVLIIDCVRLLVFDDLGRPHLPERRPFGVVLARLASSIGAILQHRDVAVRTLDARRAEARFVGCQNLDAVDEPVAKIVAELEPGSVDDVAMLVGHLCMAFGVNALAGALIDDLVSLKHSALVEKLNRALGRDRVLVFVVDELVGVDDELVLWLGLGRGGCGLGFSSRRADGQMDRRRQPDDRERQQSRARRPAGNGLKGKADGETHQPSSRCNSTYTPNKQPTMPGAQPATEVLRKPAPPKSLTTLVAT